MDELLPIGSVVLLKGGEKRVMIFGRAQERTETGDTWDYCAVPFPEGNIGPKFMYLFNRDQIERTFFIGMQDQEEFEFEAFLNQKMAERAAAAE